MDIDVKTKFWKRWEKAGELEKLKVVGELPIVHPTWVTPTLLNSYLVDLYTYLKTKYKFYEMEKTI